MYRATQLTTLCGMTLCWSLLSLRQFRVSTEMKSVKSCVIYRYLTKKLNFGCLSNCRYCADDWTADRAQNLPDEPPTMYSQCSRFHPNRFTFGGVIADRVLNTVSCPVECFHNSPEAMLRFGRIKTEREPYIKLTRSVEYLYYVCQCCQQQVSSLLVIRPSTASWYSPSLLGSHAYRTCCTSVYTQTKQQSQQMTRSVEYVYVSAINMSKSCCFALVLAVICLSLEAVAQPTVDETNDKTKEIKNEIKDEISNIK